MVDVQRMRGGPWGQNCFVVAQDGRALVIDPGGHADEILAELGARDLALIAILNTHGHFDHIGAVQPLVDATGADFYISGKEVPIMKTSNMLRFIFKSKEKVVVPTSFIDLDTHPAQRVDDILFGSRHEPVLVGIFDAEKYFTTHFAGEQVIIERGTYPADVQRTGGAGREPNANGF